MSSNCNRVKEWAICRFGGRGAMAVFKEEAAAILARASWMEGRVADHERRPAALAAGEARQAGIPEDFSLISSL